MPTPKARSAMRMDEIDATDAGDFGDWSILLGTVPAAALSLLSFAFAAVADFFFAMVFCLLIFSLGWLAYTYGIVVYLIHVLYVCEGEILQKMTQRESFFRRDLCAHVVVVHQLKNTLGESPTIEGRLERSNLIPQC